MKRLCMLILIPALLGAGCAARGAGSSVRHPDPPDLWRQYAANLPVGSPVRVATTDGDRFSATLLVVDDHGVTVKPITRIPEPPRQVSYDHLEQLELASAGSSHGDRTAAVVIGIATAAGVFFAGLLLAFALSGD
jgi:hypothetical protein